MKKSKLKIVIIFATVFILLMSAFVLYARYAPVIDVAIGSPVEKDIKLYTENIGLGFWTRFGSTTPERLSESLTEFSKKQNEYYDDIKSFTEPTHITASVSTKGNVLNVIYSGQATRKDNSESIEYYKEISVDFGPFAKIKIESRRSR